MEMNMSDSPNMSDSHTEFPPAGEPKDDPMKTLGKTMQELTDEAERELEEKQKKGGGSIRYAAGANE